MAKHRPLDLNSLTVVATPEIRPPMGVGALGVSEQTPDDLQGSDACKALSADSTSGYPETPLKMLCRAVRRGVAMQAIFSGPAVAAGTV
jgi:hypothetical protein